MPKISSIRSDIRSQTNADGHRTIAQRHAVITKLLLLHPFNGLFSRTTWGKPVPER